MSTASATPSGLRCITATCNRAGAKSGPIDARPAAGITPTATELAGARRHFSFASLGHACSQLRKPPILRSLADGPRRPFCNSAEPIEENDVAKRVSPLLTSLFVLTVLGAIALQAQNQSGHSGHAGHSGGRQSYGDWHSHSGGFSFRTYNYKPTPNFDGFRHHYVIHYNSQPEFNYFYNPYTKQFWG